VAGALAGRRLLRPLRYRHLGSPRLRWLPLLAAGVALAVAADRLDGGTAVVVAGVGHAVLVAGVLANAHLVGTGVLAVGIALNLASLTLDGGMPVRRGALVHAGVLDAADVPGATVSGPRHLERGDDLLPVLGDVLPVAALGTVVSFGDLIVVVGMADIAAHAARPRRRRSDVEPGVLDLRGVAPSDDVPGPATAQRSARSSASPVHDWGTAPPAAAVSGSHHSASPDADAPATVGADTLRAPARVSR
jgi:hypothetical protein